MKIFHAEIINDQEKIRKEDSNFLHLPKVRDVSSEMIQRKYTSIKKEIERVVALQIEHMINTPELNKLMIREKLVQSKQK